MEIRLQKFLAEAGIASRRKAELLIAGGAISVNGKIVTTLGTKIDDKNDVIEYKGLRVGKQIAFVYYMLHKPEGYVTTVKDQFNRPAVIDLLKGVEERVFPVGRLDYDTSGLLLFTNDGGLTYKLTHPKHRIEKTYEAKLYGTPDLHDISVFRRGVEIEGVKTKPARMEIMNREEKFSYVKIMIEEGRNRQVRKMCDAIKHPVAMLKRTATGELQLGDLPKGKFRKLTEKEIGYLLKL